MLRNVGAQDVLALWILFEKNIKKLIRVRPFMTMVCGMLGLVWGDGAGHELPYP